MVVAESVIIEASFMGDNFDDMITLLSIQWSNRLRSHSDFLSA